MTVRLSSHACTVLKRLNIFFTVAIERAVSLQQLSFCRATLCIAQPMPSCGVYRPSVCSFVLCIETRKHILNFIHHLWVANKVENMFSDRKHGAASLRQQSFL